jgi:hypothetical protein
MPDRIYRVEQLSEPVRRAWASTNTCNAVPDCSQPPTHKIWSRGKRKTFRLACTIHAKQVAKEHGLTIDKPKQA